MAKASARRRCPAPTRWVFWVCANAFGRSAGASKSMRIAPSEPKSRRSCHSASCEQRHANLEFIRSERHARRGPTMKVLIADDHPIVRSGLRQILGAEDDMTIVGEAENGAQTLDLVRKTDWDVAVLDYSMP